MKNSAIVPLILVIFVACLMSSSAAAAVVYFSWDFLGLSKKESPAPVLPPSFDGTVTAPQTGNGTAAPQTGNGTAAPQTGNGTAAPQTSPIPPKNPNRQVGMYYETWFGPPPANIWGLNCNWGTPKLGKYESADPKIIDQHTEWMVDAGIDFVCIDWSNNCFYMPDGSVQHKHIEDSTYAFAKRQAQRKREGKSYVEYCVFIGSCKDAIDPSTNGPPGCSLVHGPNGMKKKADQIYDQYIRDPDIGPLYWNLDGKPFLASFVLFCEEEAKTWSHPKFTYRPMVADIKERYAKSIFWSWIENRFDQGYTVGPDGKVECVTVNPMLRGTWPPDENPNPGPGKMQSVGRKNGNTFKRMWDFAISLKPRIVMVGHWNQWVGCSDKGATLGNENWDQEYSTDIEPMQGGHGNLYLQILKEQVAKFKNM